MIPPFHGPRAGP